MEPNQAEEQNGVHLTHIKLDVTYARKISFIVWVCISTLLIAMHVSTTDIGFGIHFITQEWAMILMTPLASFLVAFITYLKMVTSFIDVYDDCVMIRWISQDTVYEATQNMPVLLSVTGSVSKWWVIQGLDQGKIRVRKKAFPDLDKAVQGCGNIRTIDEATQNS